MVRNYDRYVGVLQHLSREFRAAATESAQDERLNRYAVLLDQIAFDLLCGEEALPDE